MALAAALALIGALLIYGLSPRPSLGTLEATGNLTVERGPRVLSSTPEALMPGDLIRLGQGCELRMRLDDGSLLTFDGPGQVRVDDSSRPGGAFHAHLEEGRVKAAVEPRRGKEFRISSSFPKASAVVVGTRFTMTVKHGLNAVLSVQEGEVRFQGEHPEDAVSVSRATPDYEVRSDLQRPHAVPVLPPPGPPEGAGASFPDESAGVQTPVGPKVVPAPAPDDTPDAALPPPKPSRIPPETDLPVDPRTDR